MRSKIRLLYLSNLVLCDYFIRVLHSRLLRLLFLLLLLGFMLCLLRLLLLLRLFRLLFLLFSSTTPRPAFCPSPSSSFC